jgi:BTB/POZ domain
VLLVFFNHSRSIGTPPYFFFLCTFVIKIIIKILLQELRCIFIPDIWSDFSECVRYTRPFYIGDEKVQQPTPVTMVIAAATTTTAKMTMATATTATEQLPTEQVVLVVQGRHIPAHRRTLALVSNFFRVSMNNGIFLCTVCQNDGGDVTIVVQEVQGRVSSVAFFLGMRRILIWPDIRLIQKPDSGYPVRPDTSNFKKPDLRFFIQ